MTEEDIRVGKYALATCIYVLKDIKIVGRLRLEPAIYTFYLHVSVYFIPHILYKGSSTNVNAYVDAKTKTKTK